jgi:hypothetical protein
MNNEGKTGTQWSDDKLDSWQRKRERERDSKTERESEKRGRQGEIIIEIMMRIMDWGPDIRWNSFD